MYNHVMVLEKRQGHSPSKVVGKSYFGDVLGEGKHRFPRETLCLGQDPGKKQSQPEHGQDVIGVVLPVASASFLRAHQGEQN